MFYKFTMIYPISYSQVSYNTSFTGKTPIIRVYDCDSFVHSSELKFFKKCFNYAPENSEVLKPYKGPKSLDAGLSTEDFQAWGGGYLSGDIETPLSTTGVRTCAVVDYVDEDNFMHFLHHVHHETGTPQLEKFIREKFPHFTKVNIVGGDQFLTCKTMKKILQVVENINPFAEKNFYYTVSENPEIVAYRGDMYYMKGKTGKVTFNQEKCQYDNLV